MFLICKLLLSAILINTARGRFVQLTLRENLTQPCPGVRSDIVEPRSVHVDFEFVGGAPDGDQVNVVSNGHSRSVRFPGCYDVHLSFALKKPLDNPYIEAFLQLGDTLPCRKEEHRLQTATSDICTNITTSGWCPQSSNEQLRGMLKGKKTCQFCYLCSMAKQNGDVKKYVQMPGEGSCDTSKNRQSITFRMCTPSRREIREREGDEKLEFYWNYLKQGVLTTVIHVMDRRPPAQAQQCQRMCDTYRGKKQISKSYKKTLLRSIEETCAPNDTYAACLFHIQRFDVVSDF